MFKDLRTRENGAKAWIAQKYSPMHPKTKLWKDIKHCQLHDQNLLH